MERWPVVRVEMHGEVSEQYLGRLLESFEVVPPAMAAQLVLQEAPDALHQIEVRRVRRQPERLAALGVALPAGAQCAALVIADVVEHDHRRHMGRQRRSEVVGKLHGRLLPLARSRPPNHLPRCVVHRAEHRDLAALARRRDAQRLSLTAPDLCQVRIGVDFTFIRIDQTRSFGVGSAFFCSHASTCAATATAARSCRWVKSWRGRR